MAYEKLLRERVIELLQTSLAYMNSLGFRPRGEGKHFNTFKFLLEALPQEFKSTVKRFQKLRQKRNRAIYQVAGVVSEKEAYEVIEFAERFHKEIKDLIKKR